MLVSDDSDPVAANLSGADLRGADLRDVRNLGKVNMRTALFDENTKFPDGFDPLSHGMVSRESALRSEFLENLKAGTDIDVRGMDLANIDFHTINERILRREGRKAKRLSFKGLDISGALNLDQANLSGLSYDLKTVFPEGFKPHLYDMVLDIQEADLRGLDLRAFEGLKDGNALTAGARIDLDTQFPDGMLQGKVGNMSLSLGGADGDILRLWDKDLSGSVHFHAGKFQGKAVYNDETVFPEGFDPEKYIDYLGKNFIKGASFRGRTIEGEEGQKLIDGFDIEALKYADFRETKIVDVDFHHDISYADFSGADMEMMFFYEGRNQVMHSEGVIFRGVKAEKIRMRNRSFKNSDFRDAVFSGDNFIFKVHFGNSDLRGADFSRWKCKECNFSKVRYDEATKFPEGHSPPGK